MSVKAVGGQQSVTGMKDARLSENSSRQTLSSASVREDTRERRSQSSHGSVSQDELRAAVEGLNQGTQLASKKLQFQIHDKTDRMMVRVINSETDEVIKEIPPEKALEAAAKIKEYIGMLLDERV